MLIKQLIEIKMSSSRQELSSSSSSSTNDLIKECEEQLAQAIKPTAAAAAAVQVQVEAIKKHVAAETVPQNLAGVKRAREEEEQIPMEQIRFHNRMNVMRAKMTTHTREILSFMEGDIIDICTEYYQIIDAKNKVLEAEVARLKAKLDSITKAIHE